MRRYYFDIDGRVIFKLTAWSRTLAEKLTIAQLVRKLLACYGTRKFVSTYTGASHWSIS